VHWIDDDPTRFLDFMPHLVHDFQCDQVGPEHSVSLVPGGVVQTFAEGEERNLDALPKVIQHKVFSKSHPVALTEEEQVIYRGFENMVPFIAGGRLPWPEPPKDCDMFQCVEKEQLPPSETVNLHGDRTFGTTVKLLPPPLEPGQVASETIMQSETLTTSSVGWAASTVNDVTKDDLFVAQHETSPTASATSMGSETGSADRAIPTLRQCDATMPLEKRDATSSPVVNEKGDELASSDHTITTMQPPAGPPKIDLASPSVGSCRDPWTGRSTQSTCLNSGRKRPRDRTPSRRIYDQMSLDELAREMKRYNIGITKAVLVELVRRRWEPDMDPYIEKTAYKMIGNKCCSVDATKVTLAWKMDRALNDLWAGECDISSSSKNNGEQTIRTAVTYLADLSTRQWFDEVFNQCGRRETLLSGIDSASDYLRRGYAPPIAERELLRLTSL
jgi:hypothetical protein